MERDFLHHTFRQLRMLRPLSALIGLTIMVALFFYSEFYSNGNALNIAENLDMSVWFSLIFIFSQLVFFQKIKSTELNSAKQTEIIKDKVRLYQLAFIKPLIFTGVNFACVSAIFMISNHLIPVIGQLIIILHFFISSTTGVIDFIQKTEMNKKQIDEFRRIWE
jgi:hypothetical protein